MGPHAVVESHPAVQGEGRLLVVALLATELWFSDPVGREEGRLLVVALLAPELWFSKGGGVGVGW